MTIIALIENTNPLIRGPADILQVSAGFFIAHINDCCYNILTLMNQKDDNNTVIGTVTEALPNTLFRVDIGDGKEGESDSKVIITYLAGKMRIHRIKVLVGDRVEVLLDPYGGKGRIIKRV